MGACLWQPRVTQCPLQWRTAAIAGAVMELDVTETPITCLLIIGRLSGGQNCLTIMAMVIMCISESLRNKSEDNVR